MGIGLLVRRAPPWTVTLAQGSVYTPFGRGALDQGDNHRGAAPDSPQPLQAIGELSSFLAFQGPFVRLAAESLLCLVGATVIGVIIPWPLFGVSPAEASLASMMIAVTVVVAFDRLCVARPEVRYREVISSLLQGAYDNALTSLENLSPYGRGFVRCPHDLFHLLRARIFTAAKQFEEAQRELDLLERVPLDGGKIVVQMELLAAEGILSPQLIRERVQGMVNSGPFSSEDKERLCDLVNFECAKQLMERGEDWREAQKILGALKSRSTAMHPSGEPLGLLAHMLFQICRLKTGEAEEGIENLSLDLPTFEATAFFSAGIHTILSFCLLSRARYYATHGEPKLAVEDLKRGMSLCKLPVHAALADTIIEELKSRYPRKGAA